VALLIPCLRHRSLSVLYEFATDLQYVLPNGERDRTAERVAALSVLARDEAARIDEAVDQCLNARKAVAP
jgi:hypothetical protein